jgi:hypothetical protein
MPLKDMNVSIPERVKKGQYFADCTLRNESRKISPVGHMALIIYKATCVRLLQLENQFNTTPPHTHKARLNSRGKVKAYRNIRKLEAATMPNMRNQNDSEEEIDSVDRVD